jgi:uncharacterized protein
VAPDPTAGIASRAVGASPPLPASDTDLARGDVSSHEAVLALLSSSAEGRPVEMIETHMSWVYLLPDEVLKLKKPVRHAFLDFTTLADRERACRAELQLNARLAPCVYRGLLALTWRDGGYALMHDADLAGQVQVKDWLVCMQRLPRERMLHAAMAAGQVRPGDIDAVVRVLADFFRAAVRIQLAPGMHLARLRDELALNREVLLHPRWEVVGARDAINALQTGFIRHQAAIEQRAAQGHIADGHGDLRPEHVCLLDPPVVIDCIEFNPTLREVDPFDELAFLAMECRLAGAAWIGQRLIDGCARALDDRPPESVMRIYTAHRALIRARLSLAHLFDPQPREPERWLPQAQRYVDQALIALAALPLK